jgi:hypothetical protein
MRGVLLSAVKHSMTLRPLLAAEELKTGRELAPLADFLVQLGLFNRRGDRLVRTTLKPGDEDEAGYGRVIARIIDSLVAPHSLDEAPPPRQLPPELAQALDAFAQIFQPARIEIAQELFPREGGLALVAGWFPCGFSSELMSIAGKDVVIVEERKELVAMEEDRLSLIPQAQEPLLAAGPAASGFHAVELMPLAELDVLREVRHI